MWTLHKVCGHCAGQLVPVFRGAALGPVRSLTARLVSRCGRWRYCSPAPELAGSSCTLRRMSSLAADWTSALANVALVVGAGITAVYAVKAYRKQSDQTRLFQKEALRDMEQRRRAQASHVFVWVEQRAHNGNPEDMGAAACIRNTSGQPVYDIALGLGDREDQRWAVLMPGDEHVLPGLGTAFASGQRAVWAAFRDSAGIRWRTTAGGQFAETWPPAPGPLAAGSLPGSAARLRPAVRWRRFPFGHRWPAVRFAVLLGEIADLLLAADLCERVLLRSLKRLCTAVTVQLRSVASRDQAVAAAAPWRGVFPDQAPIHADHVAVQAPG